MRKKKKRLIGRSRPMVDLPKKNHEWKRGIDKWVDEILDKWETGDLRGKKMQIPNPSPEREKSPDDVMYHLLRGGKSLCGGSFIPVTKNVGRNFEKEGHPCPDCVKASIEESDRNLQSPGDFDPDSASQKNE
jgi:hypothetical protein